VKRSYGNLLTSTSIYLWICLGKPGHFVETRTRELHNPVGQGPASVLINFTVSHLIPCCSHCNLMNFRLLPLLRVTSLGGEDKLPIKHATNFLNFLDRQRTQWGRRRELRKWGQLEQLAGAGTKPELDYHVYANQHQFPN